MSDFTPLLQINYATVTIGVVAILIAIKSVWSLGEWFVSKLGIEFKSKRKQSEDHQILATATQSIEQLKETDIDLKKAVEEVSKLVINHETQMNGIKEQLTKIQNTLDEREVTEFKRMRHEIVQSGEAAMMNGSITIRQLKSLEELYEVYHQEKHGNGYVTTLMYKIRELPIVGKLDENNFDIEE